VNHNEFDLLCMGVSGGVVAGTWLGYQLRKIVTRVADHGNGRPTKGEMVTAGSVGEWIRKTEPQRELQRGARVMREVRDRRQAIPIGPRLVRAGTTYEPEPLSQEADSDRDDVVAALVGAGYSKKVAAAAVDDVSPGERADINTWTVAALNNAFVAVAK